MANEAMTPPEAAQALAKQIVAECYKGPFARYGSVQDWEQCIAKHLTAALNAREREVWEKAAMEVMNTKLMIDGGVNLPCGSVLADIVRWCNEQAGKCRRQGESK